MPAVFKIIKPTKALEYWRSKGVKISNKEFRKLKAAAHEAAFTIGGVENLGLLAKMKNELGKTLAAGGTFADWKKYTVPKLSAAELAAIPSPARLNLVFRNATQSAAMAGQWAEIQSNKDDAEYLLYEAISDNRVRPDHAALNGTIRKVDDPIWETIYPPNGHNCRCAVVQLSGDDLKDLDKKPTTPAAMNRKRVAERVDTGWDRIPGQNWEALGAQTAARQYSQLAPTAQRTAWAKYIEKNRDKINADISLFVSSAAVKQPQTAARNITRRILPPLHKKIIDDALLNVADVDIVRLAGKGISAAALQKFFTKGIQKKPDEAGAKFYRWKVGNKSIIYRRLKGIWE